MKLIKSQFREAKRFHNYLKLLIFLHDSEKKYKVSKEYKRNEIIVIGGEWWKPLSDKTTNGLQKNATKPKEKTALIVLRTTNVNSSRLTQRFTQFTQSA